VSAPENVFCVKGRIERWLDCDTVEVHLLVNPPAVNTRVRLKDEYGVERSDPAHAAALADAKARIGGEMDYVRATNTRHHFTFGRLEARLDPA